MTINYETFRMRYGVRKPSEIFNPRLVPINNFPGIPWNSVFHYVGQGVDDVGPTADNLYLRNYKTSILVDTIQHAKTNKGNPRRLAVNIQAMTKTYHTKNFRIRPLKKWETAAGDKRTPLVVNYAMFPYTVRYINNFMLVYNRWFNTYSTLWTTVNELAKKYNRQHFIPINIPDDMPSIGDFRRAEGMMDEVRSSLVSDDSAGTESHDITIVDEDIVVTGQCGLESFSNSLGVESADVDFSVFDKLLYGAQLTTGLEAMTRPLLEVFMSNDLLTMLDLWAWMGENRDRSLMSVLSKEALKRVNLCFVEAGRITVLNLDMLDKMRQDDTPENSKGLQPKQAQRLVLRYLDAIIQLRSVKSSEDSERQLLEDDDEAVDVVETGLDDDTLADDFEIEGHVPEAAPVEVDMSDINQEMKTLLDSDDEFETPSHEEKTLAAKIASPKKTGVSEETLKKLNRNQHSPDELVREQADDLAEAGAITAQDYRRIGKLSEKYKTIKPPYGGKGTLEDFLKIDDDTLFLEEGSKIPADIKCVPDKSMLGNTLQVMQKRYLSSVIHKDIANAVCSVQREGIMIQDYKIEKVRTYMDEYDTHTVSVIPVKGAPSTFRLKIPHIRKDGTYLANGVRQRINPQRGDKPIRKISSTEVGLTSYAGKLFVNKASRSIFNADRWILNTIASRGMDAEDNSITNLLMLTSFSYSQKLPAIYSLLTTRFSGFEAGEYTFYTHYDKRGKYFTEEEINQWEDKTVLVARRKDGVPVVVDYDNVFYACVNNTQEPIGTIEDVIGLDHKKRPVEIIEVGIFGKPIPLGLILGYYVGLDELLKILNPTIRRVRRADKASADILPNEFAVEFEDEFIVFEKGNKMVEFIFGGFNRWPKDLKRYSVHLFNKPQVYEAILERNQLGARYSREIRNLFSSFIDHITASELKQMGEPEDLFRLFIRSAEMLTTMDYPAASDMSVMRDKGYERIAGFVYSELNKAMRVFKSKSSPKARFETNPQCVWMAVVKDATNALVEDSNPVANMKEQEIVVYGGQGGRSQRSLQGNHRAFHKSQLGSTSEATKDSGKVATIVYTSADPKYNSLRGTTSAFEGLEKDGPARLFSPSMLLAPASDREDARRTGFTSVQNGQTISCSGAVVPPLRTGYENVVAHRVGNMFCVTAEQDGKITLLDKNHLVIQYKDGHHETFQIGRRFGVMAGTTMVHDLITDLSEGQSFKQGDVLAWNDQYFERDHINPTQVLYKVAAMARVVFIESDETFEDASAITPNFAKKMISPKCPVRKIRVKFDREIRGLVKIGEKVIGDSIICTIENPLGEDSSAIYDEKSRETLADISSATPRAKTKGTVAMIEVLYNGDIDDMSESLKKIAVASNKALGRTAELRGEPKVTGKVELGFKVDNVAVATDEAIIKVYITGEARMGVGDKLTLGNQLKSIVSQMMVGEHATEDGQPTDIHFSYTSNKNRIVESSMVMGTTNTLLIEGSKHVLAAYRGKK